MQQLDTYATVQIGWFGSFLICFSIHFFYRILHASLDLIEFHFLYMYIDTHTRVVPSRGALVCVVS